MLNGLQVLRAFAAYAVVAFHVFEFLHADPGFGVGRFEVGEAGVDLFFVLSGFIMV
ncbi:MAG: acyltransferase family protein [Alphaproteobacteria bacterium]|nr:acyltransferase family protein [Alphaproteobacteria bacterium]